MQSRYYRELFPVEKEKMMSEMIWLLTNRQNNRYYEHIASPWRSRFVRLKMPVTGEDYHETDAEMYGNDFCQHPGCALSDELWKWFGKLRRCAFGYRVKRVEPRTGEKRRYECLLSFIFQKRCV